jgi:hypothetical protein
VHSKIEAEKSAKEAATAAAAAAAVSPAGASQAAAPDQAETNTSTNTAAAAAVRATAAAAAAAAALETSAAEARKAATEDAASISPAGPAAPAAFADWNSNGFAQAASAAAPAAPAAPDATLGGTAITVGAVAAGLQAVHPVAAVPAILAAAPPGEAAAAAADAPTFEHESSESEVDSDEDDCEEEDAAAEPGSISIETIRKVAFGVFTNAVFQGFGTASPWQDEIFLVNSAPIAHNSHMRTCKFGSQTEAGVYFNLAYATKNDHGLYDVFKFPISPGDKSTSYPADKVYPLPRIMSGRVLFLSGTNWSVGDIINFQIEFNAAGNFQQWLYSIKDKRGGVFRLADSFFTPLYNIGYKIIVRFGRKMLPGNVTSCS